MEMGYLTVLQVRLGAKIGDARAKDSNAFRNGVQLRGVTEKLNGVTDGGRRKLNGVTDGAPEKGRRGYTFTHTERALGSHI